MSGCRPAVGRAVTATAVASLLIGLAGPGPATAQIVEWPSYAADTAGTKYTPVDQINAATVDRLAIVWRQSAIPDAIRNGETLGAPVAAQNTPLMADGRSIQPAAPSSGTTANRSSRRKARRSGRGRRAASRIGRTVPSRA